VRGSREELLLAGLAELLEAEVARREEPAADSSVKEGAEFTRVNSPGSARVTSPYQVVVFKCEECGRGHVQTSRGRLPLSAAAMAAVECDSHEHAPGQRNRATIPPARRRAVLERDGYRCRMPGCNLAHFLEVHHIEPRVRGGGNGIENLVTLCAGCHKVVHEQGDTIALAFRLPKRPPEETKRE